MKELKDAETLAEALVRASSNFPKITYNKKVSVRMKTGGMYHYSYTDLGGIHEAVYPHLHKEGITVSQDAYTLIQDNRLYTAVTTELLHKSGQTKTSTPLLFPASNSIQDMGGQITYMKRYSLAAILGIATEEDDDANKITHVVEAEPKPAVDNRLELKPDTPKWDEAVTYVKNDGDINTIIKHYRMSEADITTLKCYQNPTKK